MENELMAKQAEEIKQGTIALVARVTNLVIDSPEKSQVAAGILGDISAADKKAEELRKSFTVPLNLSLDNINLFFKQLRSPLVKAKEILNSKVRTYYLAEQERALIAAAKVAEEAEKARLAAERAREAGKDKKADRLEEKAATLETFVAPPPVTTIRGMAGGTVSIKKHWRHRITNPALVPDEYWVIDESLIRKAVDDGLRNCPGVEIFEDIDVATRA